MPTIALQNFTLRQTMKPGIALTVLTVIAVAQAAAAPAQTSSAPTTAAPITAISAADHQSFAPDVAVGPNGEMAVVWLDRGAVVPTPAAVDAGHDHSAAPGTPPDRHLSSTDLYFAKSVDGGTTFSAPVRVNDVPGSVWGFSVSKPRVAIARSGTVHILFPANDVMPKNGKAFLAMYYTRSTDGGLSFVTPRRLHSVLDLDQSSFMDGGFATANAFGTIGIAPDNSVHALWVDTRNMQAGEGAAAAFTAVSTDDGASFSAESVALPTDVCPCCQLNIAFDAQSNLYIGSRRVTSDGQRNATVTTLTTRPGAPHERVAIGGKPWKIDGCPLKPTVVAVNGSHVYAAVFNGGETPAGVYFSTSENGGATFGPAQNVHPDAAVADAPAIALAGKGAVLAWHAKTAGVRRLYWRRVAANGALGPIGELPLAEGAAQNPALATRNDGRTQIVWQQKDRIFTTTLPDSPVLRRVAANN